ncbi:MAG: thioredoxin [Deltaproteobacteria bacterium RBG_16_71_12]|nr:MAG: thioredoxin [Deltaproteobacteria bacterium RBG_16_71_12]
MATRTATDATFNDIVEKNATVLVDFWADWCGPCKRFAPVFEAASEQHADVVFAKVDTEAEPALAAAFGIRSIPTLLVFRDQVLIFQQAGSLPAAALEDLIEKVKALDMDKVRAEIAEHEKLQAAAS